MKSVEIDTNGVTPSVLDDYSSSWCARAFLLLYYSILSEAFLNIFIQN
jgi:hypothetical protein